MAINLFESNSYKLHKATQTFEIKMFVNTSIFDVKETGGRPIIMYNSHREQQH